MKTKRRKAPTISTYYEPCKCDFCEERTNYVESIAINVPEVIFTSFESYKAIPHFIRLCPKCYLWRLNRILSANNQALNISEVNKNG